MDLDSARRFGPLLRRVRTARGLSQEELAHRAEVSPRHLSFLENGRSAPSREMVLVLANALDLPLRDRNAMLGAAGFAPVYPSASLDDLELEPVRRAIDHILRVHEPFGAMVLDRDWNVVRWNEGAKRLFAWALEDRTPPPEVLANALRAGIDPRALRPAIANWPAVAAMMVARLQHEIDAELDDARRARLAALRDAALPVPHAIVPAPTIPFVPLVLRARGQELRLFTTFTTLGTPVDVTAQELRIESYFPADAETERALRALAGS